MDNKPNTSEYLKTKVLTAAPEQLQMMLYDGAIRFCEQARHAIENEEIENSFNLLSKAEKILLEMFNSMRDDDAPQTCANMRRLYLFCYERLVVANMKKDIGALDEALKVLHHIRETWGMLVEKLQQEKARQQESMEDHNTPTTSDADPDAYPVGANVNFEG